MKYLLGCVVSALCGGAAIFFLSDSSAQEPLLAQERIRRGPVRISTPTNTQTTGVTDQTPMAMPENVFLFNGLTPDEQVNVSVYENVNRSVANITTKTRSEGLFLEVSAEGAGSGSVIDRLGHILTNYHVVEGAKNISVTLHNGKSYDATLIGRDAINDVAVLRIDAPPEVLYPVTLGDSAALKVGMRVFAIGNPFGLERTLTTGIISSLNRSLQIHGGRTIKSIIQIDAAINPGNSGGPLVDAHSRLIGMNTAIASKTGQSAGVGFAIPVNLIARIVPQLIARGRVVRPEVGITRVYQTDEGLLIAEITPGGPAERAGLRGPSLTRTRRGPFMLDRVDRSAADLIVQVDGVDVKTADDFLGYVESKEPGHQILLTIKRQGKQARVAVILGGGAVDDPAPDPDL